MVQHVHHTHDQHAEHHHRLPAQGRAHRAPFGLAIAGHGLNVHEGEEDVPDIGL